MQRGDRYSTGIFLALLVFSVTIVIWVNWPGIFLVFGVLGLAWVIDRIIDR